MKKFNFISPLAVQIFETGLALLPGLEKFVAYQYDIEQRKVKGFESVNGKIIPLEIPEILPAIQKLRKAPSPILWSNVYDLPFEDEERSAGQYSISDELDNNVLCLKFRNEGDQCFDLYFFYLPEHLNQFHLSSQKENLATANKSIIAKLIFNAISHTIETAQCNGEILKNISNTHEQQRVESNELRLELKNVQRNYAQSVIQYSLFILDKINHKEEAQFKLSDAALDKLATFKGEFGRLESILSNAASTAFNLSLDSSKDLIIDPGHLVFYEYKSQPEETQQSTVVSKYAKTIQYLDKYEAAAQELLINDLSVNGKNVAQHCNPPISAAAITINIKSHRNKIVTLMERHPDKWMILREHFKPIQNALKDRQLGKTG